MLSKILNVKLWIFSQIKLLLLSLVALFFYTELNYRGIPDIWCTLYKIECTFFQNESHCYVLLNQANSKGLCACYSLQIWWNHTTMFFCYPFSTQYWFMYLDCRLYVTTYLCKYRARFKKWVKWILDEGIHSFYSK